MMILKQSLFVLTLTVISIAESTILIYDNRFNNAKMNCFIKHLKQQKMLKSNIEEFPSQSNFNLTNCENFVGVVKNFYYERIKNGSTFEVEVPDFQELLEEQGDCIVSQLKNSDYGDLILKSLIFDSLSELTNAMESERNLTVTKLQASLSSAISSCTFTALYDAYNAIRRNNYCARKYVVEHNIMGIAKLNLTLNPFHIDISNINCTEIIQKMIQDATSDDDDLTPFENIDAALLLSHEWAIIFLTEVHISKEQRENEKKKYEEELLEIEQKENNEKLRN